MRKIHFFLESVVESHIKRRNCKTELVHKSEKIFIYRHVKIMLQHFKENCNEPSICSNGQTLNVSNLNCSGNN